MTSCAELHQILKKPEKEKIKIELKNSSILKNEQGKRNLCSEIVAMANRHGGKIILGINDNGDFEGKGIFKIDRDKGIIDNICHINVSPSIDYVIEFLECDDGDVLIINVQKRKGIPHAFIVKRDGSEIKNRIYYIRTEHGKRLVSDSQLEWLFKNLEDPNFSFPFSFNINYFRKNFGIPVQIPQPDCLRYYVPFVAHIPDEDIEMLKNNYEKAHAFFVEISPFALLYSFAWAFSGSWLIQIDRRKGKTTWTMNRKISNIGKIAVDEFPKPDKNSILSQLSWDFSLVLKDIIFHSICMPEGTKIKILSENKGYSSKLQLSHDEFNLEIDFQFSSTSPGLYPAHPYRNLYFKSINNRLHEENSHQLFQYIDFDGTYEARFEYPEQNIDSFNDYYHLANSIKEMLQSEWDYDTFSKELPSREIYSIDSKLDSIQTILDVLVNRKS
jgi:hypothetical protein